VIDILTLTFFYDTGIYGHSAVYHRPSNSIYIHGGYEYLTDRATVSSNLYVLDLGDTSNKNASWSVVPPDLGNRVSSGDRGEQNFSR
jgi:hypothetical protein